MKLLSLHRERVHLAPDFSLGRPPAAGVTAGTYREGMPVELTRAQADHFLAVAKQAAARVSRDDQVVGEAADHAVVQLGNYWEGIAASDPQRRRWVEVVAANHARRLGAKLHRELPMGRAGSIPPPMYDDHEDEHVARLIAEMELGGGSLGSAVAIKVDFEDRWALLGGEDRSLLHAKYVEGLTSKEIAEARGRGESPGTIDNKLTRAKKIARLVMEDLLDELRGRHQDEDGEDR
jgi:DNA-directed RNA polymerase specialized sigma24 family protein